MSAINKLSMGGLEPPIQGNDLRCLQLWMGGLNPPMVSIKG